MSAVDLDALRVDGSKARLAKRDPDGKLGLEDKASGKALMPDLVADIAELQHRLYAEDTRSLLVVLQGIDASGKDGTIRKVFTGVNPQGCRVSTFKAPAGVETQQDYLRRCHVEAPQRGMIRIWNRSHYEDIVTVGVLGLAPPEVVERRVGHVNAFEQMLADEGTTIVKVFLHISPEEQLIRLQARLDDPTKYWKFETGDIATRKRWDDYMAAYDAALSQTSTETAPWYVVPGNRKWVRDVAVAELVLGALRRLDPQYPPGPDNLDDIALS